MAHYVCGFLLNLAMDAVVLIEKNRPAYMVGKLNGVGGSVEKGETAHDAMVREFAEETDFSVKKWRMFLSMMTMRGDRIDFFVAIVELLNPQLFRSVTDEKVHVIPMSDLHRLETMPNVPWELEMAKSIVSGRESTQCFHVIESEQCQTRH